MKTLYADLLTVELVKSHTLRMNKGVSNKRVSVPYPECNTLTVSVHLCNLKRKRKRKRKRQQMIINTILRLQDDKDRCRHCSNTLVSFLVWGKTFPPLIRHTSLG